MQTALFNGIRSNILKELDNTQERIRAAVAWFTNHHLFDKLCEKLQEGKRVELIIIDDFINCGDWGLDFQRFIDLGGYLYYGDPNHPMHHKFCIIDDHTMFNGSYNWTYYAESKNVENTVKIKDHEVIKQFIREFESLKNRLSKRSTAIKRNFNDLSVIDFFSARNYLAYDLFTSGTESRSIQLLAGAVKLSPSNLIFKLAYDQLTTERITKKINVALGIESRINGVDGKFSILMPKDSQVPESKSGIYYTVFDNQTAIRISTYCGCFEDCIYNTKLGHILIEGLPLMPAKQANVTVTFTLSEEGKLTVRAQNNHTGSSMEAEYPVDQLLY